MKGAVMEHQVWRLCRGHEVVGVLTLEAIDMFWTDCRFEPSNGWPALKPFVDASRAAWGSRDQDAGIKADEAIYALGLELVPDNGGAVIRDFLLRIDGDTATARFRY
ncbi:MULTISPECIES: hypothetical protein [unclassified Streptomyces]|uniref:hypothetical protein n=1 Tax=unclassified Streptomyces TaxID=2593676 RepID=UPI003321FE09